MAKRRRHSIDSQTSGHIIPSSTTDYDLEDEHHFPIGTLSNPETTTWEDRTDDELTAPVKLPPPESMTVQLAPINLVERLDEYQSDENLAHTLIGLFVGGALGILSDWAVGSDHVITQISIILISSFLALAICVGIWLLRIKKRKTKVADRLLGK